MDDVDCTCRASDHVRYNPGLLHYPCPVHHYVFASKTDRIEMLEERVSNLECLLAERRTK
jgi:hypothetical protein